jgi:hypothetical protein
MFRTVPLSIIKSFSLYTQQWYTSYSSADSFRAAAAGSTWNSVPPWSCSKAVCKPVWRIPLLCVQWKTLYDGQRNCPKHLEFHSKNKFEKLVHLVGFIIRKYQIHYISLLLLVSHKNGHYSWAPWHVTWHILAEQCIKCSANREVVATLFLYLSRDVRRS